MGEERGAGFTRSSSARTRLVSSRRSCFSRSWALRVSTMTSSFSTALSWRDCSSFSFSRHAYNDGNKSFSDRRSWKVIQQRKNKGSWTGIPQGTSGGCLVRHPFRSASKEWVKEEVLSDLFLEGGPHVLGLHHLLADVIHLRCVSVVQLRQQLLVLAFLLLQFVPQPEPKKKQKKNKDVNKDPKNPSGSKNPPPKKKQGSH